MSEVVAIGNALRALWRRVKGRALAGGIFSRLVYTPLVPVARWLKRKVPIADVGDLALWLMYHPEVGVLPCDGWKMVSPPRLDADEIARLRERRRVDAAAVENRLSLEDVESGSLSAPLRGGEKVAVHVHSFFPEIFPRILKALGNIPVPFDLFVSVPEGVDLPRGVDGMEHCVVERCPNRGRDIAPMLCTFGERLARYDFVAHFHTKKSLHVAESGDWLGHSLFHLLGDADRVKWILGLLEDGYGIVAPPEFAPSPEDPTGWMRNRRQAQRFADLGGLDVDLARDFTPMPFPKGSMFWARGDFLKRLFALPMSFEDFPPEPIGIDGSPAHALERLFFLWGMGTGLKVARLTEVPNVG